MSRYSSAGIPIGPLIPGSSNNSDAYAYNLKFKSLNDSVAFLELNTVNHLVTGTTSDSAVTKAYVDSLAGPGAGTGTDSFEIVSQSGTVTNPVTLSASKTTVLRPLPPNNMNRQVYAGAYSTNNFYYSIYQASDSKLCTYISGTYSGIDSGVPIFNKDFTQSPFTLQETLSTNAGFILKYDQYGTVVSIVSFQDNVSESSINSMTVDASDNLYVCGIYHSGADPFPVRNFTTARFLGNVSFNMPSSGAANWGFLVKYSPSGAPICWTIIQSANFVPTASLNVTNDTLMLSGKISSTATVYNFMSPVSSLGSSAFQITTATAVTCVLKWSIGTVYDSQVPLANSWTTLRCNNSEIVSSSLIKVFNSDVPSSAPVDTVYIAGFYINTSAITVNNFSTNNTIGTPGPFSLHVSVGAYSSFIVSWDPSGAPYKWTLISAQNFQISNMLLDPFNNIYICGTYNSDQTFDVTSLVSSSSLGPVVLTIPGTDGTRTYGYIIKYSSDSSANSWTTIKPSDNDPNEATQITGMSSLASDSSGRLYCLGTYTDANNNTGLLDIFDFTNTNNLGPMKFELPVDDLACLFIAKWSVPDPELGYSLAESWTKNSFQYIYTGPGSLMVDASNSLYALNLMINSNSPDFFINFFDMTSSASLGIKRASIYNIYGNLSYSNKYLPSGTLDLGQYTQKVYYTVPVPDSGPGSKSLKNVLLKTTNYQYIFNLQNSADDGTGSTSSALIADTTESVTGVFGQFGRTLTFYYNGTRWNLIN